MFLSASITSANALGAVVRLFRYIVILWTFALGAIEFQNPIASFFLRRYNVIANGILFLVTLFTLVFYERQCFRGTTKRWICRTIFRAATAVATTWTTATRSFLFSVLYVRANEITIATDRPYFLSIQRLTVYRLKFQISIVKRQIQLIVVKITVVFWTSLVIRYYFVETFSTIVTILVIGTFKVVTHDHINRSASRILGISLWIQSFAFHSEQLPETS